MLESSQDAGSTPATSTILLKKVYIIMNIMKKLLLLLTVIPVFLFASDTLYFNNGKDLKGEILEANATHALIKRSSDLQLFRIAIDSLTQDNQAYIKNNFPPSHEALPKFSKPLSINDLNTHSKYIDSLVETKLRSYNLKPNKEINDETFLRRAYLKIIGRTPSFSEVNYFINNKSKTKRQQLIDQLLGSEGYVSHWFNFWADILRIKDRLSNRISGIPYKNYVKEFISNNRPYDVWVREMLSSSGPLWERGNEGVSYFARDVNMPLDSMANTVRIFLGTSLECAQCHDHPFDRWTQKQFYEMAAFTSGSTNLRRKGASNLSQFNRLVNSEQRKFEQAGEPQKSRQLRNESRSIQDILQTGLDSLGSGKINLPKDYQYDNAKPNEALSGKTIFGQEIDIKTKAPQAGSREIYANWLATDSNPRFTAVIVNRLWKEAFGLALIEPIDNMFDDTIATDPKLQLHLEKVMVALDYDLKEFLRILYNTKTFQRQSVIRDVIPRDNKDRVMPVDVKWIIAGPNTDKQSHKAVPYFYQGPILERMSGEQVWDSLVNLIFNDIDSRKLQQNTKGYEDFANFSEMTGQELFDNLMASINKTEKPKANNTSKFTEPINTDCPIKPGRAIDPTLLALNENGETVAFCCESCVDKFKSQQKTKKQDYQQNFVKDRNSVRASELSSPAPVGHLIREFGGSDREQIENSNKSASATQVLNLVNGFVETRLLRNKNAQVIKSIQAQKSLDDKIKTGFKFILNRNPSAKELSLFKSSLKGDKEVYKEIIWILINTHEFIFIK